MNNVEKVDVVIIGSRSTSTALASSMSKAGQDFVVVEPPGREEYLNSLAGDPDMAVIHTVMLEPSPEVPEATINVEPKHRERKGGKRRKRHRGQGWNK